jgi:hypothetical protein
MVPAGWAVRVTFCQRRPAERVRCHPKGPGKSTDVVRRPVLLCVCRGPFLPPVVMDQERLLMFSRTPGRIWKLLRKVRGMSVSLRIVQDMPVLLRMPCARGLTPVSGAQVP